MDLDELIEQLMRNIPQSWESGEGSAESIVINYLREIEQRLLSLGGSLEHWDIVRVCTTACGRDAVHPMHPLGRLPGATGSNPEGSIA